jgi:cell division transport system permease protein
MPKTALTPQHSTATPAPLGRDVLHAALALDNAGGLSLLTLLTALLGWVLALGAVGAVLLGQVYADWQLGRQHSLSLYLPAEAEAAKLVALEQTLAALPGVESAQLLPPAQVQALVAPYVANPLSLPLPVVVDVQLKPAEIDPRTPILSAAQQHFPTAEADDPRPLLAAVASGVRVLQSVGLALGAGALAVMALVVALVVGLGLRAQRPTVQVLLHLGAPDARLLGSIARVVATRALLGWGLAAGLTAGLLSASGVFWPVLQPLLAHPPVWLAALGAPLVLPLVAVLAALAAGVKGLKG